jgi:hypothetical protein
MALAEVLGKADVEEADFLRERAGHRAGYGGTPRHGPKDLHVICCGSFSASGDGWPGETM